MALPKSAPGRHRSGDKTTSPGRPIRLILILLTTALAFSGCGGGGSASAIGAVNAFLAAMHSGNYAKACSYVDFGDPGGGGNGECPSKIANTFSQQAGTYAHSTDLVPVLVDQQGPAASVGFQDHPGYTIACRLVSGHWLLSASDVGF